MRKKNWAALLCSILILASIGLGVSIIYSDYYFSPVSGLQSFTVADVSRTYLHPEEDAGTPSAAAPSDELYALLERWALENEVQSYTRTGLPQAAAFWTVRIGSVKPSGFRCLVTRRAY